MRNKKYAEAPVIWKEIDGYYGAYEVNNYGEVAKPTGTGRMLMKPIPKERCKGSVYMSIRLSMHGKRTEYKVSRLVWNAFVGQVPDGFGIVHKNGCVTDNRLWNLKLVSRKEIGERYGGRANRRMIEEVAPDGNVVDLFRSSREAAKHEHMSYQTILDRCNGKVKKAFALNGYSYRWEE